MRITLKSSCLVKPAEPTWSGCLSLSECDQLGPFAHFGMIYFYESPSSAPINDNNVIETLTSSLRKILFRFYPLAGRLSSVARGGGRLELNCNAAGAHFITADSNAKIDDLNDFTPSPGFRNLIPSKDSDAPIEQHPLLLVQLTRFRCGGISLGLLVSHVVADGVSAYFIPEWARLARGESFGSPPPFLDRNVLLPAGRISCSPNFEHTQFSPPPKLIDESSVLEFEPRKEEEARVFLLKLAKSQIEKLKSKANIENQNDGSYTTSYEALTAHIWRSTCKARAHKPEQSTAFAVCVNIRSRMNPPMPPNYFGNAILNVIPTGCSGDIISNPLSYASSKIREAIKSVTDEYINSYIDFLKNQQDRAPLTTVYPFVNPNLRVISWSTLPIYGIDFGWGKEIHLSPGFHDSDGDGLILQAGNSGDGSLLVALCLKVTHMEDFKKFFYHDIDD